MAQGRITKTTNLSGFAVDGAALLAGFYHRSVLRCGCLAERNPGVASILTAARATVKKSGELSRTGYLRQHGMRDPNLWNSAPTGARSIFYAERRGFAGGWSPPEFGPVHCRCKHS
jgi:hypothetical protein